MQKYLKVILLIGIIFISGCVAMRPIIEFKPLNEHSVKFDLESSVVISRQRNTPSRATIALPNVRVIRDLSSYNEIEITYNDVVLFDGKTQQKTNNGQKIVFQANDWLWDFERKKRSFTQSTDNLRPDQLFTNTFDENEIFDYLTGEWETYTTPWIADFDARTYVVPADANLDYSDALNSENLSGKGFMDFLANASYLQDIYRYFYWFNNIDNDRFLFFQPDGWGKIWDNFDFSTLTFSEITEYLFNNIVVWGIPNQGYIPSNERWTESTADGWSIVVGGILNLSNVQTQVGSNSLKIAQVGTLKMVTLSHSLSLIDGIGVDLNNMFEVNFDLYVPAGTFQPEIEIQLLTGGAGTEYYDTGGYDVVSVGGGAAAGWETINYVFNDFSVGGGTPDWNNINFIKILLRDIGSDNNLTGDWYIDNFYIQLTPVCSDNLANNSGKDQTSIDDYGFRSIDMHIPWYEKISDCNQMASNIVNYLSDPHYSAKIKINEFKQFDLNDNIKGSFFDTSLTLPIDKISWIFKPNEEVITTTELGIKRIALAKVLQKLFGEVETERYDRGQTHYVY